MLAGTGRPFDSADHLFDAKWDGLRSIAFFGPAVRLQARSLREQTRYFPELAAALAELPGAGVLDGEIVVMDGDRSSFTLVMERNRTRSEAAIRRAAGNTPAWFVAFDLLHRDGARLTAAPLLERRRALDALLPDAGGRIFANPLVVGEGLRFFDAMRERNMEGMVGKRLQSPYRIGERSDDWLKIKIRPRAHCVVFGTLHRNRDGPARSLVVGAYGPEGPVWLGNVGSGLDNTTRTQLAEQLGSLECAPPPGFGATGDGYIRYVRPLLVVSVEYLELTPSGHLRHPAFVGFEDRDPRACRVPAASGNSRSGSRR
jgi:ATP-dependent DNA ligase